MQDLAQKLKKAFSAFKCRCLMSQKQWAEVWHTVQNGLKSWHFPALSRPLYWQRPWGLRCWIHHGHIPPAMALSWSTEKAMQRTESRVVHKLPSISASLQRFLLISFACHSTKILRSSSWRLVSPLQLLFLKACRAQVPLPQKPFPYRLSHKKGVSCTKTVAHTASERRV